MFGSASAEMVTIFGKILYSIYAKIVTTLTRFTRSSFTKLYRYEVVKDGT